MSELNNHTRLFKAVKACTELNWQEKAILSEIISYQLNGDVFDVKDITLAYRLGMDKGTVSKFINRLHKKGLINKITSSYQNQSGDKPKRLRTITVINIEQWTEKDKTPPAALVIEKKKKVVIEPINEEPVSQTENSINEVAATPNEIIVNEVEQTVSEAETIPTINYHDEVSHNKHFYNELVEKVLKGEQINYVPINVYFSKDKIKPDEAICHDAHGKVLIKSKLMSISPELFK